MKGKERYSVRQDRCVRCEFLSLHSGDDTQLASVCIVQKDQELFTSLIHICKEAPVLPVCALCGHTLVVWMARGQLLYLCHQKPEYTAHRCTLLWVKRLKKQHTSGFGNISEYVQVHDGGSWYKWGIHQYSRQQGGETMLQHLLMVRNGKSTRTEESTCKWSQGWLVKASVPAEVRDTGENEGKFWLCSCDSFVIQADCTAFVQHNVPRGQIIRCSRHCDEETGWSGHSSCMWWGHNWHNGASKGHQPKLHHVQEEKGRQHYSQLYAQHCKANKMQQSLFVDPGLLFIIIIIIITVLDTAATRCIRVKYMFYDESTSVVNMNFTHYTV